MKHIILIKTPSCAHCPAADKLWSELKSKYNFDYKTIDATSEEGQKLVQEYSIMSVPTTIIDDKVAFTGMPNREKAEEAVTDKLDSYETRR